MTDAEKAIRKDERAHERAIIREWIFGAQIDLTWQGVKDIHVGSRPRPWGRIREARNRGLNDVLTMLAQRDREAK